MNVSGKSKKDKNQQTMIRIKSTKTHSMANSNKV